MFLVWLSFFLNDEIFGQFFDFICYIFFKNSKQIDLEELDKKKMDDILNDKKTIKIDFIHFHYLLDAIFETNFQFQKNSNENKSYILNINKNKLQDNKNQKFIFNRKVTKMINPLKINLSEKSLKFENLKLDGIYNDLFQSFKLFLQSKI